MGHGTIYGPLYTAAVFPPELHTDTLAIGSFVSSVDNAGRNIGVVGQSGSLLAPKTSINVYLSTSNIC